ncbi:MAG: HPr family phosphocarrier protein [Myxococcota bacterium]
MKGNKESVSKKVRITNELGMHARAAAKFVKLASSFVAEISVSKDDQTVNGKSIMGILMLAAGEGAEITVSASGKDAAEALFALESLVKQGFGENHK